MSDDNAQAKPNPLRSLWPDVKTDTGRQEAAKAGAISMVYVALSYILATGLIIFKGEDLIGGFADTEELVGTIILNVLAILMACLLAWLIWKRRSLVATGIGLVWIAAEVAMKLAMAPGRGTIIAILALLFSINAMRSAVAAKRKVEAA
ncbi:hypothetical protein [Microvirga mediterraneensis]|uniref:Uncharacterized protein n=1 Tax=Microvirga mediterraneensis TaxID=2754695 RepID=A0A838BN83_9HYPH|nr:hypothetical protein [Microvirga mediterraneensis]MBA1156811.1 hypothetical protein [Microvirga mediterraneensis]